MGPEMAIGKFYNQLSKNGKKTQADFSPMQGYLDKY